MAKRPRYVYPLYQVAHMWANQSQPAARTQGTWPTLRYDGPYAWHGRDCVGHITRATLVVDASVKTVVLLDSDYTRQRGGWGHTSLSNVLWHSLNHDTTTVFWVPYPDDPKDPRNVAYLFKGYVEQRARLIKPRSYHWGRGDTLYERIADLYESAQGYRTYCQAFGIDEPNPEFDAYIAQMRANFAKYYDPKNVNTRERRAAVNRQYKAKVMALAYAYSEGVGLTRPNLSRLSRVDANRARTIMNSYDRTLRKDETTLTPEQWRAGEGRAWYGYYPSGYAGQAPMLIMLRKRGDLLETSRGAEVPWEHAKRIFTAASQVRCNGSSMGFEHGNGPRIGHFRLDRIDCNGDVHAGCHHLFWQEMLGLAIKECPALVRPCFPLPVVVTKE